MRTISQQLNIYIVSISGNNSNNLNDLNYLNNLDYLWSCPYCIDFVKFNFDLDNKIICVKCKCYYNIITPNLYRLIFEPNANLNLNLNLKILIEKLSKDKTLIYISPSEFNYSKWNELIKKYNSNISKIYEYYVCVFKEESNDDILNELCELMDMNDYISMKLTMENKNFDINQKNSYKDKNLILHAGKTCNIQGVKFCIDNFANKKCLTDSAILAMCHYKTKLAETIKFIDLAIENDANIYDLYQKTIQCDINMIHKHLLVKWINLIDLNWIKIQLMDGGSNGNFKMIYFILNLPEYNKIIGSDEINKCLYLAIMADKYCDLERYKLIKYLTNYKNAKLSMDLMEKINYFLTNYSEYNFISLFYSNHLYMPDLFKKK